MPIKPENRHRYPANWKEVQAREQVMSNYVLPKAKNNTPPKAEGDSHE